jgi:DNA adenine methylase
VSDAPRLFLCKYPGGKTRIARWVVDHLPAHGRYVEAFAGAASVLLHKPRCQSEYLIERDAAQATLLRVVRDRAGEFAERMARVRFSRDSFEESRERLRRGEWADDLDLAGLVYVRRQLSWGGEGKIYSSRSRRDLPAWWSRRVGSLAPIGARLQGVEIIEGDALEWLPLLDGPDTLAYCDPPYVWSTRTDCRPYSRHEMDDDDHRRLLKVIDAMAGKVVLSGYPSPLYDRALEGWWRETTVARCHAYTRGHRPTRTEVLWMSYARC